MAENDSADPFDISDEQLARIEQAFKEATRAGKGLDLGVPPSPPAPDLADIGRDQVAASLSAGIMASHGKPTDLEAAIKLFHEVKAALYPPAE